MSIKISSDPMGQLRLFRSNTFSDPYVFIAEALQNSQRAGATEVDIMVRDEFISITDNGIGMDNPEDLFTIAKTGWSEETIKSQDPFGIGFFSALAIADTIIVESKDKSWLFSYPEAVETGSLEVKEVPLDTEHYVKGFSVELINLTKEYNYWNARSRAISVCSTLPNITCTVNGSKVSTYDVTIPPDEGCVLIDVPDLMKGWIGLAPYSWSDDIKIYHYDRFVDALGLTGLKGAISIELKALNLRAPDRRAIIKDSLYQEFVSRLKKDYLKPLLLSKLKQKLTRYEIDVVNNYLDPKDYAGSLYYTKLTDADILDQADRMSESDLECLTEEQLESMFSEAIKTPDVSVLEEYSSGVVTPIKFEPMSEDSNKVITLDYSIESQAEDTKVDNLSHHLAYSTIARKKELYYAEPVDLKKRGDLLRELVEAGKTVVVVKTTLESNVLKQCTGAKYIGDMSASEEKHVKVVTGQPNTKFNRVKGLVSILASALDRPVEILPGAVTLTETRTLGDYTLGTKQTYPAFYTRDDQLFINTNQIKHSKVLPIKDTRVDLGELRYVLQNVESLASSLNVKVTDLCKALSELKISWIVTSLLEPEREDSEVKECKDVKTEGDGTVAETLTTEG